MPVLGAESLQGSGEPERSVRSDALGEADMGKGLSSPSPNESPRPALSLLMPRDTDKAQDREAFLKSGLR